jgi:CRP-like cAMP-binding protein
MNSFIEKYCTKEWKDFINFHKEIITFKEGEYIFKAEEETKGLYIIDSGKVKITYKQYDGSKRLIRLATNGDILGHRGFGGSWKYPISAYTLEESQISFIPVNIFNTVAKANAEFSYHLMMFFAEELRQSEAIINHYPVKNLVAKALHDNYRVFGFESEKSTKLSYTLTRKDIASLAGTTYETVVRTLAEFNKKNIINIDGKTIHILDLIELENIANPEYKQVE